jgi:hypothetical protein
MAKSASKPSNRRLYRLLLESLLEGRSQPLSRVGRALADKAEVAIVRALTATDAERGIRHLGMPATTGAASIEKAVKRLLSELQRLRHDDLLKGVDDILNMAEEAAKFPEYTAEERQWFQDDLEILSGSLADLICIFAAHDIDADTWKNVDLAVQAAFSIGANALINPIVERIRRELQKERAARATTKKLSNSVAVDRVILAAATPFWTKQPGRKPNWVAGRILDSINEALKAERLRPMKIDAVRKRVARLRTN